MTNEAMLALMEQWREVIERRLDELSQPPADALYSRVYEPIRYSLLHSGKRIRPILALEFCRVAGEKPEAALDCACAVEMIHTYSLIHDDLPCMDDDDMRRGKPSCHKVYGEANALLAGDALQALAAKTIAGCSDIAPERLSKAALELFHLCGAGGMVAGQMIDIDSEGKSIDVDTLRSMITGKTGALIEAACVVGCHVGGADEATLAAARDYSRAIGLAFQIIDDILDVEGDPKLLGKPVASDAPREKANYVSIMGINGARRFAQLYTENAVAAIKGLGEKAQFLSAFAVYLLERIS